jgi:predicted AAA+ superfamily ATPase
MSNHTEHFWEKKGWERDDPHLSRLKNNPFQRKLPPPSKLPGIYSIRGPRQIGKTTYLKQALSHFCKVDPKQVGFIYCDEIEDFKSLRVAIDRFANRSILILDEISFVKEWWRTVKSLADQATFKIIILTGSNSWDIKLGADLMPGRFGSGGEIEILPMDFKEFKTAYQDAGYSKISHRDLLDRYLLTGGFPIALFETQGQAKVPIKAVDVIRRWLLGDAIKLGKNETYLKDLLLQVAVTQQSTLSLQKLAQRSQIGSHHTAIDYVALLESTFCLKTLYAYDPDRDIFQYKKDKKFYFRDPIYYHLAHDWSHVPAPENQMEKLAEMSAFEYLNRRYPRLGYLSSIKGEVDFIVPKKFAVEVKWSSKQSNLSALYQQIKIQKTVWQPETFFDLKDVL